ncbi:hypothetical protein pmac_cds_623 [Pandoravirus macleodensis]|uniref:Uncharacterized protein n=1 Tax=Pandoravirus macleodensis TaxID=2107707 RepID=A0A2U7UH19_9VIRU|nr:hypothetical protein pmac_cds_623 [Pandoravirus macleodensis]AVK77311.1 hypothetical protein pmac_cds_623 [Pandoravirus macleodensis]
MQEVPNCDALLSEGVQRLVDTLARLTRSRLHKATLETDNNARGDLEFMANIGVARAVCARFPGAQHVCDDWQKRVTDHAAAECDPRGLLLCIEAVNALGVVVNDACIIDDSSDLEHAPLDLDTIINADDSRESINHMEVDVKWGISDQPESCKPCRSRQILLSCSRTLPERGDGNDAEVTASAIGAQPHKTGNERLLVVEVRLGLGRRPWATAGDVVNLGTSAVIGLHCMLVCGSTFDAYHQIELDAMLAQRRLLADFLCTANGAWSTFASRRYANLQRLPEVLVARGWSVKDVPVRPWMWGPAAAPGAETLVDGPALWIKRPDLPHTMTLVFNRARLMLVPGKDDFVDHDAGFDWPTFFPSDAGTAAIYGELDMSPVHHCDPLCINNDHKEMAIALQREKLIGMGLVSPLAVSGRDGLFYERDLRALDKRRGFMRFFDSAMRALVDADPTTLADAIDAHVAQSIFAEYGLVDDLTGRRLNGSLCDYLACEAVDSGRLWSGLVCVNGVHFTAAEGVIDPPSDDQLADPLHRPRLVVNWQSKYTPTHTGMAGGRAKRFRMTVWAIAVAQSDGYGGACVAVRLSKGAVNRVRKSKDARLWRGLVDRCARGSPDYPPGLHPAVTVAVDLERACGKRVCVVPWAYHTGGRDGRSADARSLTTWVLDCVKDVFAAFDAQLSRHLTRAERNRAVV